MNKLKFLLLTLGVVLFSCSDLEEQPVGLLAPDGFFQTTADIQTAANAAIGHMIHEDFWGRKMSLTIMLRGDMVDIGDPTTSTRRIEHNDFNVPTDNGMIDGYWLRTYQIVAAANQAIIGAQDVEVEDAIKNPVTAQAHFSRAFTYFHLVRQFGDIPFIDENTDLTEAATAARTPAADVYASIISDLEFAAEWLPATQAARSIPSKAAAESYLALVHLTLGNWQEAYDNAMSVISNESAYGLGLEPDFQDLFDASLIDGSPEPIFTLDHIGATNGDDGRDYQAALTGIRGNNRYGYGGGWSVAVPSLAVFETWDDRDYRKDVSFDASGTFDGAVETFDVFMNFHSRGVNRPHIAKYTRMFGPTATGNGRGSNYNYSMIRYAEVLLIAAEALNEINPGTAEAEGFVNRVRARAANGTDFPAPVESGMSQGAFRDMVMDERRLELAFEFKRWYDIARRELGSEVFSADGLEGAKANFDPSQDYLFPLPANEIDRNPSLTQNPGY